MIWIVFNTIGDIMAVFDNWDAAMAYAAEHGRHGLNLPVGAYQVHTTATNVP